MDENFSVQELVLDVLKDKYSKDNPSDNKNRDDDWLNSRLNYLWGIYFKDVERKNHVFARFKGKWKNKFGHIRRLKNKSSEIAVNSFFKNKAIPEFMVDLTLAHELVHYSHGFHSPLKRLYKHPHKGGIVTKELKKRGFKELIKVEREFIKTKWIKYYKLLNQDL
jgi:hypothetical protein